MTENRKFKSENFISIVLVLLYNTNFLVQVKSMADAIESIAVNFKAATSG